MTTVAKLPRWAQLSMLLLNAATAALVAAHWWLSIWPNLAAEWIWLTPVGTAGTLAATKALDGLKRHIVEHVDNRLAEHHEQVKAHVDRALAAQPPQQGGEAP